MPDTPVVQTPVTTIDLRHISPDYTVQLGYMLFIMRNGEQESERADAARIYSEFRRLNESFKPNTRERFFLDRIASTAIQMSALMVGARERYVEKVKMADREYETEVRQEWQSGLTGILFTMASKIFLLGGVLAFVFTLSNALFGWSGFDTSNYGQITMVSLAVALGSTMLIGFISQTWKDWRTYNRHRANRQAHAEAMLEYHRSISSAVQLAGASARLAWIDFVGTADAPPSTGPIELLIRTLIGNAAEPVPPAQSFWAVLAGIVNWRGRETTPKPEAKAEGTEKLQGKSEKGRSEEGSSLPQSETPPR
jgi:hypothetical protein